MRGQRFALAGLASRARRLRLLFRRCLLARGRDLALFKGKGQLVGVELFRASAKLRPLELADDVVHRLDPTGQLVALGQEPQRHGPQARHVLGKGISHHHREVDSTIFRLA